MELRISDWRLRIRRATFGFVVLSSVGCSTSAQQVRTQLPSDVVATVGSITRITLAQVDAVAMQQPAGNFGGLKLSQAVYEARRAALESLVSDALVDQDAIARKTDRASLLLQEVSSKVAPPTDDEIAKWYDANKDRVRATFDQVRQPIRDYLTQQRTATTRQAYVDSLKAKFPVKLMLEPPRQAVKATGPSTGPSDAPIEMIEFSDFQCPYCLRAYPTVKQVLDMYGKRIHFVYRNYPLPNHPNARPAAEAAECANEQGQFWRYYDRLFANPAKLSDADLKQAAAELGLDAARFNGCYDARRYQSAVDADLKEGAEAGVSGTPAFFINGRLLSGAQPFDAFKRIIDEELDFRSR